MIGTLNNRLAIPIVILLAGCLQDAGSTQQERRPTISELLAREREKSAQARKQIHLQGEVFRAIEQFSEDLGRYPTTPEGLAALIEPPASLDDKERSNWSGPYLPQNSLIDPWGNPLRYQNITEGARQRTMLRGNAIILRVVEGKVEVPPWEVWSLGPDGADFTHDDVSSLTYDDAGSDTPDSSVPWWLRE